MFKRTKFLATRAAMVVALFSINGVVMAQPGGQGNGAAALTQTATTIRGYGVSALTIVMALGVVIGLMGGVRVYSKYHAGDPDSMKGMMNWFVAALFLVAIGAILTGFFG